MYIYTHIYRGLLEAVDHEGELLVVPVREALLEALDVRETLRQLDSDEQGVGAEHLTRGGGGVRR